MKPSNCLLRLPRALLTLSPLGVLLATAIVAAAPAPAPAPKSAPAAASTTAPATVTAPTDASANTQPPAASLKPALPMDFADFAPDFHPTSVAPPWITAQVGTLETYIAPPLNKTSFVLGASDWIKRDDFTANFHPIEISTLIGAKARYDNVTLLDVDKAGHPLGYTLPLGQLLYFVARGESETGVVYSVHYYDSGKDLFWSLNPEKPDAYIPVTRPIIVTQDLGAPMESYTLLYLSNRVGTIRPDSTAKPLVLYTYLVIHLHRNPAPAASTGIVGR